MPLRTESQCSILHSDVWNVLTSELKSRGWRFALDDLNAGFGDANTTDRLVVEAIVGIARGMGKKTVAEFVTDRDMTDRLRRSGIDYAQGFHMGVPRPILETFACPALD